MVYISDFGLTVCFVLKMAPKPRFTDGEKVLCFHGPLLYEAKCLKSQIRDKHMKYFIHYSGWNKNWDEWVPECRVLKYNETNLQKQKELAKTHMKTKKTKSVKTPIKKESEKETPQTATSEKITKPKVEKKVPVPSTSSEQTSDNQPEVKRKKARSEPSFVEEPKVEVEIKLDLPDPLKDWLLDDWDLITRQKKILSLPARVTVDHVIANFVKEKVSVKNLSQSAENTIVQIANKIRDCFNVLLGKMLLYKFERPQYAEILVEYRGSDMCQIYGAIHLLRMFTKLGPLLTPMAATDDLSTLTGHLNDFTKYMSMNSNFFSLDDYIVATPEYHRRAL